MVKSISLCEMPSIKQGYEHLNKAEDKAFWLDVVNLREKINTEKWAEKREILENKLQEMKNEYCIRNQKLVLFVLRHITDENFTSYEDIFQEGFIGLLRAFNTFDPSMDTRFSTYAIFWIRQSISKAINERGDVMKLPFHLVSDIKRLVKINDEFFAEFGRDATEEELFRLAKTINRQKIKLFKNSVFITDSLERPLLSESLDDADLIGDFIPDNQDIELDTQNKEMYQLLHKIVSDLPDKDREIITLHYGLNGKDPLSLNHLSKEYGVSTERIRQIRFRALNKIEKAFNKKGFLYSS